MDPILQAAGPKLQKAKPKSKAKHKAKPKSTAQKTAASATAAALQNAAAAAAPSAPRAKTTTKKLVASAAPKKKMPPYFMKVSELVKDRDFRPDIVGKARFGAASTAASAAMAADKGSLAAAIDKTHGCSKCRFSVAGCKECQAKRARLSGL